MTSHPAIVIGISGCSSSGKTTLARLIRDIFPRTFILHEDDFYKPEKQYVPQAIRKSVDEIKKDKSSD